MFGHFSDLLMATPTDGASAVTASPPSRTSEDVDELMEAWYRERQERVEVGLFLDEARNLLRRILAEGEVSPLSRRKARRLLLALEAFRHEPPR
jgi:hypothetical protein